MFKSIWLVAALLALVTSPVLAQVVVTSRPVVTYYAPTVVSAPQMVETYYTPAYSTSRVVYDTPVTTSRPITTYYAPAAETLPVTSYYAPAYTVPTTAYYAPVTTYYPATVVASPVVIGRSAYGTLRPYVPGQPVRNTLRFACHREVT